MFMFSPFYYISLLFRGDMEYIWIPGVYYIAFEWVRHVVYVTALDSIAPLPYLSLNLQHLWL